jgi:hypothetical protein
MRRACPLARSVRSAGTLCHARLERAPPLKNEVNEKKAPALGRDFLKFVRSFDFATCVDPLRMTLLTFERWTLTFARVF